MRTCLFGCYRFLRLRLYIKRFVFSFQEIDINTLLFVETAVGFCRHMNPVQLVCAASPTGQTLTSTREVLTQTYASQVRLVVAVLK